ncbi:MAG: sulfurtransferase complex subunit TusB [Cycloclasticus sp.]|nr:sulfurtransferase complex subunit TusB [Cycloclasticus sp.]MBQ0788989.1 sulfurtransferase complex subunit TusB [Cycloclasticus sp.]
MLYIINKNPSQSLALKNCVDQAIAGDAILLIENAVYAAINTAQSTLLQSLDDQVSVYALTPDLQARGIGLNQCYARIEPVDYAGFVMLVTEHQPVRSCF